MPTAQSHTGCLGLVGA